MKSAILATQRNREAALHVLRSNGPEERCYTDRLSDAVNGERSGRYAIYRLCPAVDQYHREGFLLRPGFFSREVVLLTKLIDSERERLQALEDVTIDSAGREASCLGYLGHGDDVVTSFAATERLVTLVKALLGDDVYLLKGKLNVKWGHRRTGTPWRLGSPSGSCRLGQGIFAGEGHDLGGDRHRPLGRR